MTPTTKWLNPMLNDVPMLEPLRRNSAAEIHNAIVHQTSKANCSSFFRSGKNMLMRSEPVDLIFRDHACRQAFQEQLTERHRTL